MGLCSSKMFRRWMEEDNHILFYGKLDYIYISVKREKTSARQKSD